MSRTELEMTLPGLMRSRFRSRGLTFGWITCLAILVAGVSGAAKKDSTKESSKLPRVVPSEVHSSYRALLPIVDDEDLQAILESERILFYTEKEMPRAFAKWNGSLAGVHSAFYNISAGAGEPYGNGNREFPWSSAGGTHRSRDFETIHFVWLPEDSAGDMLPIIYETSPADAPGIGKVRWRFPHGAVVGECLVVTFDDGKKLPCELRIRRRVDSDWETDVLRPFPTALTLASRIKQLRDDWKIDEDLVGLVEHLTDSDRMTKATLADQHPNKTFDQVAGVDRLPLMEQGLVKDLLKTTVFKSCHETAWKQSSAGLECFAPTTDYRGQIVPARYDGGFIRVNNQSCLRCHATVGDDVSKFEFGREWYGVIRGSDGIFSFHPYTRSSVTPNGIPNTVQIRAELVESGIVAKYDPSKHTRENYSVFMAN